MARIKVVGIGSALFLLTAAVTWSAIRPVRSAGSEASAVKPYILLPPGAPEMSGVAHEPAAVSTPSTLQSGDIGRATPSASGRTGGSFSDVAKDVETTVASSNTSAVAEASTASSPSMIANAITFVGRSVKSAASLVTPKAANAPRANGSNDIDAPARNATSTRWTVVDVPAADVQRLANPRGANRPIAALSEPAVDPDADWYAASGDDAAPVASGSRSKHGRAAAVARKPLPTRDAGNASWYDSLGESDESSETGAVSTLEDALLAGMDPAAVFSGESRTSGSRAGVPTNGAVRRSKGGTGIAPELRGLSAKQGNLAACSTPATRWRLVKLEATVNVGEGDAAAARLDRSAKARTLPSPNEMGEPAVVLASLGPALSGQGATEYPGLAAPRPEDAPKASTFCPIGLVEKKIKTERYCARVDKTGIAFREGPVAFLYASGKKKAQGTYVNGKLEGAYVEFSAIGKKTAEGTLAKGKKNGEWAFWWDDGKKQSQGPFVNGERQGVWTYWDEKGRRLYEGEVRTSGNVEKREGAWVFYHPNGKKKAQGRFAEGKKEGAWKQFDDSGKQISVVMFKDGEEEFR